MSKVYTKTGDGGTTALVGGERVSKADPRVEAYGSVDELAAQLALWADMIRAINAHQMFAPTGHVKMSAARKLAPVAERIDEIQKDLMVVEALLATGRGGEGKVAPLSAEAIERLEREIDEMGEGLPQLQGFVIPGGHPIVSQSHVCRTVCRRAERATVRAAAEYTAPAAATEYLNRLSDWLYVAGRKAIEILGVKESYWRP